jgi:Ca2+-binding EF-hand superfamily protein
LLAVSFFFVKAIYNHVNTSGSGLLSFEEFLALCSIPDAAVDDDDEADME